LFIVLLQDRIPGLPVVLFQKAAIYDQVIGERKQKVTESAARGAVITVTRLELRRSERLQSAAQFSYVTS